MEAHDEDTFFTASPELNQNISLTDGSNPFAPPPRSEQGASQNNQPPAASPPRVFNPAGRGTDRGQDEQDEEEEQEPPLLEDLAVDLGLIKSKALSVLLWRPVGGEEVQEADVAGPVGVVVVFACLLLFQQKVHFGSVYGFVLGGSGLLWGLLTLMASAPLSFSQTFSVLGYSMLPLVVATLPAIFLDLRNLLGLALAVLCVAWCSASAVRLFETLTHMRHQRFLIAYPVGLFYACFFIFTVF